MQNAVLEMWIENMEKSVAMVVFKITEREKCIKKLKLRENPKLWDLNWHKVILFGIQIESCVWRKEDWSIQDKEYQEE